MLAEPFEVLAGSFEVLSATFGVLAEAPKNSEAPGMSEVPLESSE